MLTGRELIEPVFVASPHPAALDETEFRKACSIERGRTSGPGGQHRNKVATHVTLTHRPTGLAAQAGERRSPADNERVAQRRLRDLLAVSCRAPVPAGEIGSAMWKRRVRGGRIAVNDRHWDYPAMLAEALDVIHAAGLDLNTAAIRLECTATQLVKLIAVDPRVLAVVNGARAARGLHELRRHR